MDGNDLARLYDAGDYYGLVLRACGLFAAKYHPAARATLVLVEADGTTRPFPVTSSAACSPSLGPLRVPHAPQPE